MSYFKPKHPFQKPWRSLSRIYSKPMDMLHSKWTFEEETNFGVLKIFAILFKWFILLWVWSQEES